MYTFESSDVIATVAALIAGLAALYARRSAAAAQCANEISIHNERLKIYKAILNHRSTLASRGLQFPEESLWSLHDAVQLSEFYFGEQDHLNLKKILDDSFEVKNKVGLFEITREESQEKYKLFVKTTNKLHRKIRDDCLTVADSLKKKLKIGASKF